MRLIGVFVGVGLLVVPVALAQDPTVQVYGGRGGDINSSLQGSVASEQTLPFTGLDITLLAAAGLVLLALGIALRKTARRRG